MLGDGPETQRFTARRAVLEIYRLDYNPLMSNVTRMLSAYRTGRAVYAPAGKGLKKWRRLICKRAAAVRTRGPFKRQLFGKLLLNVAHGRCDDLPGCVREEARRASLVAFFDAATTIVDRWR